MINTRGIFTARIYRYNIPGVTLNAMKIFGIDFTSRPGKSKPLTCLECEFDGSTLRAGSLVEWIAFDQFEDFLGSDGEWIAGIDFPFGLPRKFIENIGWPNSWEAYVSYVGSLERLEFQDMPDPVTFGEAQLPWQGIILFPKKRVKGNIDRKRVKGRRNYTW